jgi:hypothetical protein
MYPWIVYLHMVSTFAFLILHSIEIVATFRLRDQMVPEGIGRVYDTVPANNLRYLRLSYLLSILTGLIASFMSAWWKQGWTWTALGLALILWFVMYRVEPIYLNAVDAITERAMKNRGDPAAIEQFRQGLKRRREPEFMSAAAAVGGLIILWLMMFKPF